MICFVTMYLFIIGYIMLVETKAHQKSYQKARKQLFDGKDRLEEVLSDFGFATAWKYVGVFYAHKSH